MRHEVRQPLRLENGRFMRGNEEVPVEIGNREQIELLQRAAREAERIERDALDGKLEVEITAKHIRYDVVCEFKCVCGETVRENGYDYETDYSDELDLLEWGGDQEIVCPKCGRIYEITGRKAKLEGR